MRRAAIGVPLSPAEHARLVRVADAQHLPLATWARAVLLREADRCAEFVAATMPPPFVPPTPEAEVEKE